MGLDALGANSERADEDSDDISSIEDRSWLLSMPSAFASCSQNKREEH
jgi:hypothetical protein